MFYFRSKDVHTQYPPDELSVSLNLIVRPIKSKHQYEFQIDSDALEGKIEARIKREDMSATLFKMCYITAC